MLRFLLAVVLIAASGAHAQELTGTLKKIKDSKSVVLGHRESSIPFSYVNKVGEPIGYSIDLCNAVVDEVSKELEGVEIAVNYKKVTAETRIPAVQSGEVDLECGSTTANFERKKEVAFSPIFFVAGTKLLVPRSSGISSYRDLRDKTVVVTAGTTNEAAVRAISDKQHLGIKFLVGTDHAKSFAMLREGKADAFATDDILLYGLVATIQAGRPVPRRRRISVLRPVWADVPQGRSRFRRLSSTEPSAASLRAASWCSSTTNGFSSACRPARPSTCR